MNRLPLMLVTLLALGVGCSSPRPAYQPFDGSHGYDHAQLTPDTLEVFYTGPEGMGPGAATELAKVRAAELTLAGGREAFVVVAAETGVIEDVDVTPAYSRIGLSSGYGRRGYGRSGFGGGFGYAYSPGYVDIDRHPTASLRVDLRDGDNALDAQTVLDQATAENPHYPPPVEE